MARTNAPLMSLAAALLVLLCTAPGALASSRQLRQGQPANAMTSVPNR